MTASFILVGAVATFRGSGLKPILVGTALTVALALVGVGIRQYGLQTMAGSAHYTQNLNAVETNKSFSCTYQFRSASLHSRSTVCG
jgi:hypothetical protein